MNVVPDWYFFILLLPVISIAWIKLLYSKFLDNYLSSALSYQIAHKNYSESGIVRKRIGLSLDIIYLISGAMFLLNLFYYYNITLFGISGIRLLAVSLLILLSLIALRLLLMNMVSVLFHVKHCISEFLYHYYLYNKILGLVLIPFLFLIPYTEGFLQDLSFFIAVTAIIVVNLFRVVRIIVFLLKNVIFIFYLILYLCVLEIAPFLIIIKFLISLDQGS